MPRPSWLLAFVVLARVLVALVAAQASGAVHFLSDVVEVASGERHASEDCSDEGHCPPGCPSCHHGCGSLPSLPPASSAEPAPSPPDLRQAFARPSHEDPPPSTERASVFRPPRSPRLA